MRFLSRLHGKKRNVVGMIIVRTKRDAVSLKPQKQKLHL
jgi:hypothetical protein